MSDYYFGIVEVDKYIGENMEDEAGSERILMFLFRDQLDQFVKDKSIYTFQNKNIQKTWICHLQEVREAGDLTPEMVDHLLRDVNNTELHSSIVYQIEDNLGNIPPECK